ncbi:ABC-2 type transporter-domain-containing protein [Fimicolochytrium jonesii]|uniref:ABC-2 type transporter-domain-containing protein n=1 Tax=Fimicolochytrium jonesii TaxID=1396493 RepID=UPI0022FE3672|nr:ABC-2 type transporter-domain-containing protein [Fimicolochytrium jonesii]KAI8821334.1 ABC-2 type transporter-domain-containing protein [Fimicolochytrium jonesii]
MHEMIAVQHDEEHAPDRPQRQESLISNSSVTIDIPSVEQPKTGDERPPSGRTVSEDRDAEDDSHLKGGMEIYWEDIRYGVSVGSGKTKGTKEILKGDTGRAKPGELIAIMGGSGGGKTTLLNMLAGRVPVGKPTGIILANGKIREKRKWKRTVGYVEQEDLMYENLTVRETLMVAAMLRLSSRKYKKEEKIQRVEKIMEDLGISHIADSRIGNSTRGGISGGEKKRVSIGIELVTDPAVLFCDEPTTGLDAATANHICDMLKRLARKTAKTIIITIHMPRETILDMIDKVALMSKGRMVWFGPASDALEHFESLGHKCPERTNPADFFLDLIQVDQRDEESKKTVEKLVEEWKKVEKKHIPPIKDNERDKAEDQQNAQKSKQGRQELSKKWDDGEDQFGASWFTEFTVLLERNFKQILRDKTILVSSLAQQILILLMIGLVFLRLKKDQAGVQNRIGVLFFICINQTFSFLMPIITVWPLERRIILRERASGTYRTTSVYLAKAVSQMPTAFVFSLVFAIPVYWIVGLHANGIRYVLFLVITECLVFAAQSLGMLIGSSVPNVQMAQIFGPLVVVTFVVFGGNFANQDSITPVLRWIQWISPIRYAYGAFMQNEFNGLQFECGSSSGGAGGGRSCSPEGESAVSGIGLDKPGVGICILLVICLGVVFQLAASLMLRRTTALRTIII